MATNRPHQYGGAERIDRQRTLLYYNELRGVAEVEDQNACVEGSTTDARAHLVFYGSCWRVD